MKITIYLIVSIPLLIYFITKYQIKDEMVNLKIKKYQFKLYNIYTENLVPKIVYRINYSYNNKNGKMVYVFNLISANGEFYDM